MPGRQIDITLDVLPRLEKAAQEYIELSEMRTDARKRRDALVAEAVDEGFSLRVVARHLGRSSARVVAILAEQELDHAATG